MAEIMQTSGSNSLINLDRYAHGGSWRRIVVFAPTCGITGLGIWLMYMALGAGGSAPLKYTVLVVFSLSFGWIVFSFCVACVGFVITMLGRHAVTLQRLPARLSRAAQDRRTAVLMPIYNEDTGRVLAGLTSTYCSLETTGQAGSFDFFILSDTTDAGIAATEARLWPETAERFSASRLFYRRRSLNTGRKAGNIAEWLCTKGAAYESMIILDADSVMSGETIVHLAALMVENPGTGIIQTLPVAANRGTLFSRVLQFSSRLCGPILATGHSFWQLGNSNYYGHNAILRVEPFLRHCLLPTLSGKPPLGGEILSHDFVEGGFMRRAGWNVWLLPEVGGSFEELPSNSLDYALRDRRWVQGNLQHLRLLTLPGLTAITRFHFATGALAFISSPLWLLLLLLSSALVVQQNIQGHAYFPTGHTLFPIWPDYRTTEALSLLAITVAVLFIPRLLAFTATLVSTPLRQSFGGAARLLASTILETLFSMLLAPLMMLFHTRFIIAILARQSVGWPAQARDDRGISWREALRRHIWHSAIGLAWALCLLFFAPAFLPWVAPVVLGLILVIPITTLASRVDIGKHARSVGLFCTPEELGEPAELKFLRAESVERIKQFDTRAHKPPSFIGNIGPSGDPISCQKLASS